MDLPGFSRAQIQRAYTWFNYHVYKGHRPLPGILAQVALVKIDSTPAARFIFQKLIYPLQAIRRALRGSNG